jgi:hypothetical protein
MLINLASNDSLVIVLNLYLIHTSPTPAEFAFDPKEPDKAQS